MKKYLLAALVVLSASTFAANVTVFGGVNLNGEEKIEISTDGFSASNKIKSDEIGYTVGVELHKQVAKFSNGKVELGVGAKYETSIILEDNDGDSLLSTLPVYGSAKISFPATNGVNLYLQGTLGYAFAFKGDTIKGLDEEENEGIDTELNGGLYTGIGAGLETAKYNLGLTYCVTNSEYKMTDGVDYLKYEFKYSKLALTAGYKFGK